MSLIRSALVLAAPLAATLVAAPLAAQDQNGRYTMTPTADGFLRLDSRTGEVSECQRAGDGYRCRLVPDERNALQAEIDRLEGENASLRERLARSGAGSPEAPAKPDAAPRAPSDPEVDRALGIMERFMRRFMSILREERGGSI